MKRPRCRLPGSGIGRSASPGIAQGFLSENLDNGGFQRLGFVSALGCQAFQLDGKARHINAVADGVALVSGMGQLQEVSYVVENPLLSERQVLPQDVELFVPFGKVDED